MADLYTPDLSRYEDQFIQLLKVLDALVKRYDREDSLSPLPKRRITVVQLLLRLRRFAYDQFYFFYHGFTGGLENKYPPLDTSPNFGREHVIANTIYQIAKDLTTIQLAAEQRIRFYERLQAAQNVSNVVAKKPSGPEPKGRKPDDRFVPKPPGYEEANDVDGWSAGDELASEALWKGSGITVLCYLADSVAVRVLPYAPVALLGIPYSCLGDPRGFMAVIHEMGHFRFWHSYKQTNDNLVFRNTLENDGTDWTSFTDRWLSPRELFYPFELTPPNYPWSEEIFADVYGTLVGGPLYILAAMDLAFEHSSKAITNFDSHDSHPTGLIRPLLMIKALRALHDVKQTSGSSWLDSYSNDVDDLSKQLFDRWVGMLTSRHIIVDTKILQGTATWDTNTLDSEKIGEKLVKKAIEALRYAFRDSDPPKLRWCWPDPTNTSGGNIAALYDDPDRITKAIYDRNSVGEIDELKSDSSIPPSRLWSDWVTVQKGYFNWEWDEGGRIIPFVSRVPSGEFDVVMPFKSRTPNNWLPVFGSGGWTTEGPCTSPGHP